VTKAGFDRWTAFRADQEKNRHLVPADLRSPIYRAALKMDPAGTVAALKHEWFTTPAIDGKEICLAVLGHVQDAALVKDVLLPFNFSLSPPAAASDSVPPGDMHYLAGVMSANRLARPLLWTYLRENWDQVNAKLGGNPIIIDRLVNVSLGKFTDLKSLEELEQFFSTVSTKGFDRTLETVKDKIRGRAAYKTRDAEGVKAWLAANGY